MTKITASQYEPLFDLDYYVEQGKGEQASISALVKHYLDEHRRAKLD
ncbi:hypothetical protein [Shewanella surugensis]|uniref:CopG family transcriptional regulator n=1 Tax=Shewanella surugensis TaxID=212020 RepID=A0ABT0LF42_9GAMM|nr:hypothetical protein [Shewanella surugensis]MCL1126326.1 hypothetical protein [Shewanella surugensis]